jgi:hypothetical protein
MASVLFAVGVLIVLGFAVYMKLPLTTVYIVSLAALAFSQQPLPRSFNRLMDLLKPPAMIVQGYGDDLGFGPPTIAIICLALTFVFDIAITTALGWRRR